MTETGQELAVRPVDALSLVMGTGDTKAMLQRVEENVKAVIDVARDRGFVQRFANRDFFGEPAWQLLGMTYGIVAFVEWSRPLPDGSGWEARAVVRTRDGDELSSAEAMCTRKESSRRQADDHTLRAMAQTRARRNALRSCMGAALVLAGFDFADPEAPATREQIGMLHQLERDLGWAHEYGHERAAVDSYKELTREEAGVLIDQWTAERDKGSEAPTGTGKAPAAPPAQSGAPSDVTGAVNDPGAPGPFPIIAPRHGWSDGLSADQIAKARSAREPATQAQLKRLAVVAGKFGWDDAERHRQADVESWSALTKAEAMWFVDQWEAYLPVWEAEAAEGSVPEKLEPSAEPPDPEREALYDHARSLYPSEAAFLNTAKSIDKNVRTVADIDTDVLADLIARRTA